MVPIPSGWLISFDASPQKGESGSMELTAAEGQRRHKGIAQFNEREDYIGYIVSESENAFYMSNFLLDVQTWERPVAAIFPRQGEPLFILNELSTHHFELAVDRGSCWISQAEI
jgi:Xaa-Pro aminopeptidase